MQTTHLSGNGSVSIPEFIRMAYGWGDCILLRPVEHFEETQIEDVLGCTGYKGPKKSLRDMEDAIAKGAGENR